MAVKLSADAGVITREAAEQAIREAGHAPHPVASILADLDDPARVISWRNHQGAPAPQATAQQIANLQRRLKALTAFLPERRAAIDRAYARCRDYLDKELAGQGIESSRR